MAKQDPGTKSVQAECPHSTETPSGVQTSLGKLLHLDCKLRALARLTQTKRTATAFIMLACRIVAASEGNSWRDSWFAVSTKVQAKRQIQ